MKVIVDKERRRIYLQTVDRDEFGDQVLTDREIEPEHARELVVKLSSALDEIEATP